MNYQLQCETNELSMQGLTLVEISNEGWQVNLTLEDEDGDRVYVSMESYDDDTDIHFQTHRSISPSEAIQRGMTTQKEIDDQVREAAAATEKRNIEWRKKQLVSSIKELKEKGFTARDLTKIINGREE